jgi:Type IV secretion-system coupling protein DNA-binding domain
MLSNARYFEQELSTQEVERMQVSQSDSRQKLDPLAGSLGKSAHAMRSTQATVLPSEISRLPNLHGFLCNRRPSHRPRHRSLSGHGGGPRTHCLGAAKKVLASVLFLCLVSIASPCTAMTDRSESQMVTGRTIHVDGFKRSYLAHIPRGTPGSKQADRDDVARARRKLTISRQRFWMDR